MLARVKQLETCNREMFGDVIVTCQTSPKVLLSQVENYVPPIIFENKKSNSWTRDGENEKRRASVLVDQLLSEIYGNNGAGISSDYNSATSSKSCGGGGVCRIDEKSLWDKGKWLIYLLCGGDKWFINFLWKHGLRVNATYLVSPARSNLLQLFMYIINGKVTTMLLKKQGGDQKCEKIAITVFTYFKSCIPKPEKITELKNN